MEEVSFRSLDWGRPKSRVRKARSYSPGDALEVVRQDLAISLQGALVVDPLDPLLGLLVHLPSRVIVVIGRALLGRSLTVIPVLGLVTLVEGDITFPLPLIIIL